jgi:exosortase
MLMRTSSKALDRNGWRRQHLVLACGLVAAGVIATADSWGDIVNRGLKDEESSHVLLAPLVVLWILWVRRGRLKHCRRTMTWIGPVITLIGAIMYWMGDSILIESFWHVGAVLVATGCLLTIVGGQILWNFFPAFVALIFLVPFPGRIRQKVAIPLETATAQTTAQVCEFIGIDAQRSGNLLRINNVDVAVAEACNGMRMMIALVMVSYAFAMTTPLRGYVRFLIIALSPISAIACNVIRLVPTVWVYGHFSETVALAFHDASGWIMLFVSFLLLMLVIRLLRWMAVPVTEFALARC